MAVNPSSFIIGITGGKGGVGKSVFAANLALAFLTEMRAPTLLVDLDSQSCGDQNFLLNMRDVKTANDLANFTGSINQATLGQVVTAHPSNLAFVAAVKSREESLSVNPDTFCKQLETLSNFYKFIIVDLGTQMNALQMSVIQRSTVVLMVTIPEVLSVNQTIRQVTELMSSGLPGDMLQIVVNKTNPSALAPNAIAQTLRRNVIGAIPQDDITAAGSLQRSTPFILSAPKAPISSAYYEITRKLTGGVLQQLKALAKPSELKFKKEQPAAQAGGGGGNRFKGPPKNTDPRTALKLTLHAELIRTMDKQIADPQGDPDKEEELRRQASAVLSALMDKEAQGLGLEERKQILKEVLDEALDLGPLVDLLRDDAVTEIMVNGYQKIYIEKAGKTQLSPVTFTSNFHLRKVIERIVTPLGRQINESVPYVDARLRDGSRVNAVIEPLSIDGPAVTIRKFRKKPTNTETYVNEYKACTAGMMEFLRLAVANKMNIVISGGTGSGKTTLLNTMSNFVPLNERIVTIEDAAELQLNDQGHVVRLETKPPNAEGSNAVTIRDLVKNALRMRPDRIIVGECRDGAALDMLQAMRTGHDGSMTTIHANNPREAIGRLETLCMMAGMDLPARAIRDQVAGAVNLIVQISRLSDGTRKIINISAVDGMQGEVVTLVPVFEFIEKDFDAQRRIVGHFHATGRTPRFVEVLQKRGVKIPAGMFSNEPQAPASPPTSAAPKPAAAPGNTGNPGSTPSPQASSNTTSIPHKTVTDLKKVSGGDKR